MCDKQFGSTIAFQAERQDYLAMTFGPRLSVHCASHTMFTCSVVQCVFCKSVCRMECQHRDGKEGPTKVCMLECQKDMLGMCRQSSILTQATSLHNGILSSMTGSPQSQTTSMTCLNSTQTNGPRCLEPALTTANLTMKSKNHCSNQSNQSLVRSKMTPSMKKKCFNNKCQHQIH